MPICENPNKTAPLPTEVDHHAEAAKVKKTREQAYFNSYDFDAIEVLPSEEDEDAQIKSSVKEPENARQNGAAVANAYLKRLTLYFSNSGKHRKSVKKRSSVGVEGIQNVCERSSSSSSSTEDSSSKLYSSKRSLDDKKTANGFLLPRAMLKYQCSLGNSMSATAAGASTSTTSSKIRNIKSVVTPGDSSSCGINSKHNQCSTRTSTDNSGFTQCYDKSDRDRVISASHYSTEKSGSSGYYGSNLCSSSSVEDHIYSEPVIDIIEPRVPSLGNLSSHPSIKDDGSKDSGSCKTLTNADKITENLRILETSLENLDRHLKSYSKNGTHQRASSFAGYSFHTCLSSYEKAKSDQLPTIMEGGDCQSNKKTTNSWSEDTDSLVDIDLDSFLLENERKNPAKNKSESLKGIDNPTFEQSEILDEDLENNYKCSKYVNSCPENAYKVESVIETEQEDKSLAFFLKKYEDQIHFQSTREMLEEIRDKLRILVQSANGENTDIPKDLENNIATLKVELEAYLRIMSHTSEMEIKQFCTGVVNNQKLVTMTKAFERRKSLTSSDDCEITYEAIRSGSSPADIDNTSVRCSDPNFKLKRKTLAEIFPNTDEECYNSNNNNINNSSSNDTLRPKTEEIQALSSTGFNLQRNLSFHRPKLDNTNSKIQQEKDTILEWHKNKPSIWELYYGTNRKNQSLVGKRGQMVKNSASLMSYPSSRPESDFTLDLPRAEQLRLRMEKEKRFRQRCRILTTFLSLVFFLLTVMVVSLVLTRGKRMFGSML